MASKGLSFNMSGLQTGLELLDRKMEFALDRYCERAAEGLAGYAKQHRRWKDRTHDARDRLSGRTYKVSKGRRIELAHGVNYGIWLEMAHERKYAIIEESIEKYGTQQIMPGFQKFIGKEVK